MRDSPPGWWLLALVTVAVLAPVSVSLPLVVLVLVVLVCSRWWVRRVAGRVRVSCRAPERATWGEELEATVEVANQSRLPAAWIEVDVPAVPALGRTEAHREALGLQPRGSATCRVSLRCRRRGRHQLGAPQLRLGDVFGFGERRVRSGSRAEVTVLPRVVSLDRLGLPMRSPFATTPSRGSLQADPARVVGVRAYRRGDPSSAIHWPATARAGELMVKHYQRADARDTLVCLDMSREGYPRTSRDRASELAITTAASVLYHAVVREQLPAGLVTAWPSARGPAQLAALPQRPDRGHMRSMLELLATAEPGEGPSLADMLAHVRRRRLPPGTTVVVVSGRFDAAAETHAHQLIRRGIPVAVALASPDPVPPGGQPDPGATTRVPVYPVTEPGDMAELAA